jgi:WD40 repeat protein
VVAAAFSPDGKRLVTANDDGSGTLWDAVTGRKIDAVPPDAADSSKSNPFADSAKWKPFSPVHGQDGTVATAEESGSRAGFESASPFGPDGSWLLLESGGVWRPGKGIELPSVVDLNRGAAPPGRFHGDYYVMTSKGRLLAVDVAVGRAAPFGAPGDPIKSHEVFASLDRVVTVSAAGVAKIWRLKGAVEVAALTHPGSTVKPLLTTTTYRRKDTTCVIGDDSDGTEDIAIVTRGEDARARLWSGDGVLRAETRIGDDAATVSFASHGCRLVAQTPDSMRLMETITGREISDLRPNSGRVEWVRTDIAPDVMLLKSEGGQFDLYRQDTGRPLAHFAVERVGDTDFSDHYAAADNWLVALSKDRGALLIELASGSTSALAELAPEGNFEVALIGESRAVVSDDAGTVWLIDPRAAKVIGHLTEPRQVASTAGGVRNRYAAAADSSSGLSSKRSFVTAVGRQRIVVRAQARKPVLFDLDGRRVAELDVASLNPDSLAWGNVVTFSQVDRIALRSDDGMVSLWNGENGARIALSSDIGGSREISLVRDDASEARFAITVQDGSVIIIDALSGRMVGRRPNEQTAHIDWHRTDEKYVAAFSADGNSVEILEQATGKVVFAAPITNEDMSTLSLGGNLFSEATVSADGQTLAMHGGYAWSLWRLDPLRRVDLRPDDNVERIILGGDGHALVVRTNGGVELWRPADGSMLAKIRKGEGAENSPSLLSSEQKIDVRFIDEGRRILVLAGGKAAMFDASDGSPLGSAGLGRDVIVKVSTDRRGRFLQTISAAGAIRIVRIDSKGGILTLKEGTSEDSKAASRSSGDGAARPAFSADGKRLIIGSTLGSRVLDIATGKQLASDVVAIDPEASRMIMRSEGSLFETKSLDLVDIATGDIVVRLDLGATPRSGRRWSSLFGDRIAARAGDILFTVESDHTVRVWDLAAGKLDETRTIKLSAAATALATSSESSLLAIGTKDGKAILRHVGGDEGERTLGERTRAVNRLAFDPRGSRLLVGSDDGKVELVDVAASRSIAVLPVDVPSRAAHAFSPDGRRLAVMAAEVVLLIDAEGGTELARIPVAANDRDDIALSFSPDGTSLMVSAAYSGVRIVDGRTGAPVVTLPRSGDSFAPTFSPDGRRVLARVDDRRVAVWDIETARRLFDIAGATDLVLMSFSSDGQKIITVYQGGVLRVSRSADGEKLAETSDLGTVAEATLSPDGTRLYVRGRSSTRPRLIIAETGAEIAQLAHGGTPDFRQFSPDSRYLATHASDGMMRIFDAADGHQVVSFATNYFIASDWSLFSTASGLRLVERGTTTKLFRGDTGEEVARFRPESDLSSSSSYEATLLSSGGRRILMAGNGPPRLFDGSDGTLIAALEGHVEPVSRAVLARNGSRAVTWSGDGIARLWDAETGRLIVSYGATDQPVVGGDLSPSGNRLVLQIGKGPKKRGSDEQGTTLVLFDGNNGERLREAGEASGEAKLTVSPDGRSVVALDGNTLVWWSLEAHMRLARYEGVSSVRRRPVPCDRAQRPRGAGPCRCGGAAALSRRPCRQDRRERLRSASRPRAYRRRRWAAALGYGDRHAAARDPARRACARHRRHLA